VPSPAFGELVGRLVEQFGQRVDALRVSESGLLLETHDGFLYAFIEDPATVSLENIRGLLGQVDGRGMRLVVFSPGRLPLALSHELIAHGSTLVEAARFHELVGGLGLGAYVGDEPRPEGRPASPSQLPSAHQLDAIVGRARLWYDWGVPALSLRFYRQAVAYKPEFTPAHVGVGKSLLALGLVEDARRTFDSVLHLHPDDLEARIGLAATVGAEGDVAGEIAAYRGLLQEQPQNASIRTHLLAALLDHGAWPEANEEVDRLLRDTPEDPRLRFLRSVILDKQGAAGGAALERERARDLGLTWEQETSLSEHLKLPTPGRPARDPAAAERAPAEEPKAETPAPRPRATRARAKRAKAAPVRRKGK
jgi:tetratricopeptide (TPR) repeat protein